MTALTKLTDEETAQLYGYCMGKPEIYYLLRRLVEHGVQEDPEPCDSFTSNQQTLEELQMDTRPPIWRNHRDTFQTAGDLRSAATDLCMALRGTPHHDLAAQIHDSLVMALPRGAHVPIGRSAAETTARRIGPETPDNDLVFCPHCTSQFRAIPVNVQSAINLERQRLVSLADRWNKKGRWEEADEVYARINAIDFAMNARDADEPKPCGHLRSELLAEKQAEGEPIFQMRKCLDCRLIFRVRSSLKSEAPHTRPLREMLDEHMADPKKAPFIAAAKASASTGDVSPPTPSPSPVECPKCRTQLAFEGDECWECSKELP